MIRIAELAVFVAPIVAFILWRVAIARGLDGPPPRQLLALLAALLVMAGGLIVYAETERLPPGRYVPAQLVDGHIVRGHTE
jgi:hypothetical protein